VNCDMGFDKIAFMYMAFTNMFFQKHKKYTRIEIPGGPLWET
jgi:hypothetical protein